MARLCASALPLSLAGASLVSPTNLTHLVGFLCTRGGEANKLRLRSKVCCARASGGGGPQDDVKEPSQFPSPGEVQYFGKLSAGCVAGALLVKYGSLVVPSVTTPNINVALVMIVTPCLVSVVVLALASVLGSNGNPRKQ